MIKGIAAALLGALAVAAIITGIVYLLFSGLILWLFGFIVGSLLVAAIIFFIVIFVFAIIVLFALFYYMAEKKPTIQTHGNYKLEDEKGKNE